MLSVMVEGIDDLWYLQNIIHPGDRIATIVHRRTEKKDDMNRSKETERKPVRVTMSVEKVEFQAFSNRLRMLGTVSEGPEDILGEHQSALIEQDSVLDIIKEEWFQSERKMLREAVETRSRISTVFVAIDDDEAYVFVLRSYGVQPMGHVESGRSGKSYQTSYDERSFYASVVTMLKTVADPAVPVVVLGPGFTRDHMLDFARSVPELSGIKFSSFPASRTDDQAVYEFLSSTEAQRILRESRLAEEKKLIAEFLKSIGQGKLGTYGMIEVEKAAGMGAVSDLLVLEEKSRNAEVIKLVELASTMGARVHIFSAHSDPGKILRGFGGVSAILRYPV